MCKEQKSTTQDQLEWCDCSLHAVTSSVIYYSTHTWKNVIYLFYTIKIQMVYWRSWGQLKKEKQVRWRDMAWIWRHLCVCPLIDHSQQPMKMHTEVMLLYNDWYMLLDQYNLHMKCKLIYVLSSNYNCMAESEMFHSNYSTYCHFSFVFSPYNIVYICAIQLLRMHAGPRVYHES